MANRSELDICVRGINELKCERSYSNIVWFVILTLCIAVQERVITPITIHLNTPFTDPYYNLESLQAKTLIDTWEDKVKSLFTFSCSLFVFNMKFIQKYIHPNDQWNCCFQNIPAFVSQWLHHDTFHFQIAEVLMDEVADYQLGEVKTLR